VPRPEEPGLTGLHDDLQASVLIVDDHPIVREHLGALIKKRRDLLLVGEASDGRSALESIRSLRPDLAIVDLSLRDGHGIELIKDARQQFPDLRIVVLSMHEESLFAERALRDGASGYILKQEATSRILTAIRCVLDGQVYLSDEMSGRVLKRMAASGHPGVLAQMERLSDRELQVFQLIGQGCGTSQIAQSLRVNLKTVETYRARIKQKLGLDNAVQLVQHAVQWFQSGSRG
jgi:DNA-binding NarL/FixJ family response regulator